MSRDLIRQLKSLKQAEVKPSETWLKNNRALLLSQIKNTVAPKSDTKFHMENVWQAMSVFLPSAVVYKVVRPVGVVMLIIAMGVGSWVATVDASYEALPGEWLYSAKRATEKTQVAVANVVGGKNTATKLHMEFAKRRAEETKKIISTNNPDKIKNAAATVNDLKNEIKTVSDKLAEIKTTQNSSAEMAQNINQNAQQIKDVLKEVKVNLLASVNTTTVANLSDQVSEVKNLAKDTATQAVEVMVAKHLQGDTSVSKDDVKQAINDQLQSVIKDAAELKQNAVEVNNVVTVASKEVKEIARDAKGADLVSSTQALSNKITEASKQTQAAVSTTQQFNSAAGKTVDEGQTLLSQDNLTQAMDKVKEANTAVTQAEKIADDTLKVVQSVLPVIAVVVEEPKTSTTSISVSTTASSIIINVSTTVKIATSTLPSVISSSTKFATTSR